VQCLIEIHGPRGINRQEGQGCLVTLGQRRRTSSLLRLRQHLRWEVIGDLELRAHRVEDPAQLDMLDRRLSIGLLVRDETDPSLRHGSHPSQSPSHTAVVGPPTLRNVLILLPPSESKTGRTRGKPSDPERVSFPELAPTRARVAAALAQVSAHPDAPALLGVSASLSADIAHNVRLGSAPAVAVADLYTGVLYDALSSRRWIRPPDGAPTVGWSSSPLCSGRCAPATGSRPTACR
jgi:Protein of unknown function (DUF328).